MYPLLGCSIVAVCVAVERLAVFLYRAGTYEQLSRNLKQRLASQHPDEVHQWLASRRSPLARVATSFLEHRKRPAPLREQLVTQEASQQVTRMEKRLHWLSVIGHLAPMIGLLGTVWGLVEAFHQIESQGGNVQPGHLASGIWKALLTTVFGLVVALPTLAAYHFLDNRVSGVTIRMQWLLAELNGWLADVSESDDREVEAQASKEPDQPELSPASEPQVATAVLDTDNHPITLT